MHTDAGLIQMVSQQALETWYAFRRPARSEPTKHALHDRAVATIGRDAPVRYLEFGVHQGGSLRRFAEAFRHPDARFVGFDSFVGLPEAWSGMAAGTFGTGGKPPQIDDARVSFVKGWFQNSVPDFLRSWEPCGPVLIHFDADLYSSTLFLLTALWWHVPEYHFIFDEFVGQELAAMKHFAAAYPVDVEFSSETVNQRGEPVQAFGRLRRVPMVVG